MIDDIRITDPKSSPISDLDPSPVADRQTREVRSFAPPR
jgi:hypothetical protein